MARVYRTEEELFAHAYNCALSHIQALSYQHWPDEAKPSIDKFLEQIKFCLAPKAQIARAYVRDKQLRDGRTLAGKRLNAEGSRG